MKEKEKNTTYRGRGNLDWIFSAQDNDQRQPLAKTVIKIRIALNAMNI